MYANGETPVNCVFTARLRGHLTRESLRCALDRVQSKHPLLQAGIHEDRRGRPYFVSNGKVSPIPIKLIDRISDDDWLAVSETEWKNPFDLKQGPLFRLIWIHGIMVSELLLVSPHCISDGMSCITLLREILSLLDQPDPEHLAMQRDTPLKKTLFACDELSGFVHACALVRPTGLEGLEPTPVRKKLKQPSFAAGVHRDEVYKGAEELGVDLDDHIRHVVAALQPIAAELGLSG